MNVVAITSIWEVDQLELWCEKFWATDDVFDILGLNREVHKSAWVDSHSESNGLGDVWVVDQESLQLHSVLAHVSLAVGAERDCL